MDLQNNFLNNMSKIDELELQLRKTSDEGLKNALRRKINAIKSGKVIEK